MWSEILREVSPSKSCQAFGLLLGRESVPLGVRVFAQRKPWKSPLLKYDFTQPSITLFYTSFFFLTTLYISLYHLCVHVNVNAEGEALTWDTRLKIAIEAAQGLNFLHNSEKSVIYRDFKASNILLDSVCRFFVISSSHTLLHACFVCPYFLG